MSEKLISIEQFERAVEEILKETDNFEWQNQSMPFIILLRLREMGMFKQLEIKLFEETTLSDVEK